MYGRVEGGGSSGKPTFGMLGVVGNPIGGAV